MLVLTRVKDTAVHIGGDIAVVVRNVTAGQVVIQIDYPSELMLKTAAGVVAGEPVTAEAGSGGPPSGPARSRASVSLRVEDLVRIGENISVKVVGLLPPGGFPSRVRLGFTAPLEYRISRSDFAGKEGPGGPEGAS